MDKKNSNVSKKLFAHFIPNYSKLSLTVKIIVAFIIFLLISIPILFFTDRFFIEKEMPIINKPSVCNYESKNRLYIAKSPIECQKVIYNCNDDWRRQSFYDSCGCGCEFKEAFWIKE